MIYLDGKADTCPDGLQGTPFWEVYNALRQVAATGAWPVDPGAYRAGMAWGWYALHKPEYLTNFREVVQTALISACAPMIKPTQTDAELVEYLRQWREYRPTFPRLQSLYSLFGAAVDIQSISDPESQAVLPVDDTRLAFYLRIESVDPERPLSLSDAITIAVRATPIGSRPYAYYVQESRVTVLVALAPSGVTVWVENDTVASGPPAPAYLTAYFTNAGASATGDITLQNRITYRLYDASGNLISLDNTKIYKYAGSYVYNGDSTYIPPGYEDNPAALWYFPYSTSLTYLNLQVNGNKDAFRFEYTEIQTLTAWFSPDQSSVMFNANATKVLYDDNGEKITYNDSVTYTIYLWRTSSEWTARYVNYYKLVNLNGFLACMNTNNSSYAGFRGLRFYSQPAELS